MSTQTISVLALEAALRTPKDARAIVAKLVSVSDMSKPGRMRKTGNPFWGDCIKIQAYGVILNAVYGSVVNRQRVREDSEADFEPSPRRWGQRVKGTTLVDYWHTPHGDGCYLREVIDGVALVERRVKVDGEWEVLTESYPIEEMVRTTYIETKVERELWTVYQRLDGTEIPESEIQPYLPKDRSSAEHQGVDREVVLRDFEVSNVREIVWGGVTYQVVA